MSSDPYQLLGVDPSADFRTLRSAFLRKVSDCHPDLEQPSAARRDEFKRVRAAYEELARRCDDSAGPHVEARRKRQSELVRLLHPLPPALGNERTVPVAWRTQPAFRYRYVRRLFFPLAVIVSSLVAYWIWTDYRAKTAGNVPSQSREWYLAR